MRMSKPWAMGFCASTTIMPDISKGIHRLILGQVIELNCLKWFFNWALAEQAHLA
jgi:TM2 domain-containing membrane protein YozV